MAEKGIIGKKGNVNKLRKNEEDYSPAPRRALLAIPHAKDAKARSTQRKRKREGSIDKI